MELPPPLRVPLQIEPQELMPHVRLTRSIDEWLVALTRNAPQQDILAGGSVTPANIPADQAFCEVELKVLVVCIVSRILTQAQHLGEERPKNNGIHLAHLCGRPWLFRGAHSISQQPRCDFRCLRRPLPRRRT
jgi:hypothetical protein